MSFYACELILRHHFPVLNINSKSEFIAFVSNESLSAAIAINLTADMHTPRVLFPVHNSRSFVALQSKTRIGCPQHLLLGCYRVFCALLDWMVPSSKCCCWEAAEHFAPILIGSKPSWDYCWYRCCAWLARPSCFHLPLSGIRLNKPLSTYFSVWVKSFLGSRKISIFLKVTICVDVPLFV